MNWQEIWASISSICISLVFRVLASLLLFAIGKALIGFLMRHFPKGSERHPLDPTAKQFFMSIVKCALYILLAVTIVGILGVPLASVIAVLGSAGAVIALALQGSLSNFAAGIMLLIFKPLQLGDYIETNGVGGTVNELGLFYTTLITPDNRHITLPNSSLTNTAITNYSCEKTRRLDLSFRVAHESDTEEVKQLLLSLVSSHPAVLSDPAPFVRLTDMDPMHLNITVRVWCRSESYWDLKFDLTEAVKATFDENHVRVPHSKVDLHLPKK